MKRKSVSRRRQQLQGKYEKSLKERLEKVWLKSQGNYKIYVKRYTKKNEKVWGKKIKRKTFEKVLVKI